MIRLLYEKKFRWLAFGAGVKRYIFLSFIGLAMLYYGYFKLVDQKIKIVLFISGIIFILTGMFFIIAKLWRSSPKGVTWMTRADQMYKEAKLDAGPKIVVIGGGTGLSAILRAIKRITSNISAVVTVADNGGNSGVLRKELRVLPPGDIRNCVIALSSAEKTMESLLEYRFKEGSLEGYCMGNLFLVALSEMSGGFLNGIQKASDVLAVTGQVLPVTLDNVHLNAIMKDGTKIQGEKLIGIAQRHHGGAIKEVKLEPESCAVLPQVISAIEDADIILIGPGSLYTSILPNLLVPGVVDSIRKSSALKVYISNLMTQPGETQGYGVYDHVKAIEDHVEGKIFTHVLVNNSRKVQKDVKERYDDEKAHVVKYDIDLLSEKGYIIVETNLIKEIDGRIRHSMNKLDNAIIKVYNKHKES